MYGEIVTPKRLFIARESPLKHRRGITKDDIKSMFANFNKKAIGRDVDVDYEHKEGPMGGKAAGWVESLEMVEENGKLVLYGVPQYTPTAEKAVNEKEYKYTSPQIGFNWSHPETGENFGTVLKSIALLNNPQLIGQKAVQDMYAEINKTIEEEEWKMDKLLAMLVALDSKFAESKTEADVIGAFKSIVKEKDEKYSDLEKKLKDSEARYSELKKKEDERKIAEKDSAVDGMVKYAIESFKVSKAQSDLYFKEVVSKRYDEGKFTELKKEIDDMPEQVGLKRQGSGDDGKKVDADKFAEQDKKIEAYREKHKCSYRDAYNAITSEEEEK